MPPIGPERIATENEARSAWLEEDYEHLGRQLARRRVDIEQLTALAAAFRVSVPSWGLGTGGTRFARFPGPGEPRTLFGKARRLRRGAGARARDTRGLAAHPLGHPRRPAGGARVCLGPGAVHRLDELQHVPGPVRASACPTSSAAFRTRTRRCEGRRSTTTWNAWRSVGRSAPRRTPSGSAMAGTFPGQLDFRPLARPLCRLAARDLCRRSRTAGDSSSSTSSTSRPSIRPC